MSKRQEPTDAGRRGGNAAPQPEPNPAVTEKEVVPSPSSAVSGLMEERRRYEAWLSALEARRDATPDRVFTRVHADYTTRLEAVVAQLKQHTEGLRAELTTLTARLASLQEEQQQARDERAEAELRAHVGELTAEEWETTARLADEQIDGLVSRRADVETELLRTRELVAEAERPATPHRPSVAIPAARSPDAAVEASVTASVNAAASTVTPESSGAVARPAEAGPEAPRETKGRTSSFDELAFLSSVVDAGPAAAPAKPAAAPPAPVAPATPDLPPAAPAPRRDSIATRSPDEAIVNLDPMTQPSLLGRPAKKGTPMAANISGNNPIVLKDKAAENARTLKCADCGAMNYPTEWYCERCGAELASL